MLPLQKPGDLCYSLTGVIPYICYQNLQGEKSSLWRVLSSFKPLPKQRPSNNILRPWLPQFLPLLLGQILVGISDQRSTLFICLSPNLKPKQQLFFFNMAWPETNKHNMVKIPAEQQVLVT